MPHRSHGFGWIHRWWSGIPWAMDNEYYYYFTVKSQCHLILHVTKNLYKNLYIKFDREPLSYWISVCSRNDTPLQRKRVIPASTSCSPSDFCLPTLHPFFLCVLPFRASALCPPSLLVYALTLLVTVLTIVRTTHLRECYWVLFCMHISAALYRAVLD